MADSLATALYFIQNYCLFLHVDVQVKALFFALGVEICLCDFFPNY